MIVDDMQRMGGLVTLEDLAQYQPKVREALHASYELDGHKWDVLSSPPPSSGGVAIIEALNMLRDVPLKGWDDVQSMHMVVETMRRVFADRAAYLADPDFSKVPVDGLTSDCYAKELAATIDARHATSSKEVKAGMPHVCGVSASNASGARDGQPERWTEHDALFGRGCSGKCGGQHLHTEQQLRFARDLFRGLFAERRNG